MGTSWTPQARKVIYQHSLSATALVKACTHMCLFFLCLFFKICLFFFIKMAALSYWQMVPETWDVLNMKRKQIKLLCKIQFILLLWFWLFLLKDFPRLLALVSEVTVIDHDVIFRPLREDDTLELGHPFSAWGTAVHSTSMCSGEATLACTNTSPLSCGFLRLPNTCKDK